LDVVGESEELPAADARCNSSTAYVDVVVAVASRRCAIERDILVVPERNEDVLLIADTIEALRALNVSANVPVLCGDDRHGGGCACNQRGYQSDAESQIGLHHCNQQVAKDYIYHEQRSLLA
jgi:hypothetical protein